MLVKLSQYQLLFLEVVLEVGNVLLGLGKLGQKLVVELFELLIVWEPLEVLPHLYCIFFDHAELDVFL